ncbi:hypothetical protein [Marinomonas mediterranea]|jgi:hypothetical protein|uniref:Uncharacterized protein n=1 Tax=Marinomonas mediterranea (strain ATCC 700492 / JCM 21426 / NBRC 103028 / MMB-1) TaxID=717774 RepID=F2K475_MARM1|nr:hypothetical protein [Marinomonas mediterranea]ADZ92516.1 hypothetical protein Marme_3300 [Marinomonas mediterranea MMB-1]WCN10462.1 hypothetical protein GV055_16820 [Marinomonas mediterranea]WCN14510.1 hypothetical protein GV054_16645 [Marinomonas mediterranea]WCN18561.1 hypothetical protein GV053_16710 [Marinomonas mediterranea MMB-1]
MYEEAGNANLIMLLHTAVYPILAALLVTWLTAKWKPSATPLGFVAGFLTGLIVIHTGLHFPPTRAMDFLVVSTILGLIAIVATKKLEVEKLKLIAVFALLAVSYYLLLSPVLKHQGGTASLSWAVLSGFATIIVFALITRGKSDDANHLPMLSIVIAAATASPVMSIGGSLLIGQLLGAVAAASFGYLAICFFTKTNSQSGVAVSVFILGGLLAQSHVLADLPVWVVIALGLTPIVSAISSRVFEQDNSIKSLIIGAVPNTLIAGTVAGICLWQVWPESSLY